MGTSLGRVLPYHFLGYALRNLSGWMDNFSNTDIPQLRTELERISPINIMICGVILYHENAIICPIQKKHLQLEMFISFWNDLVIQNLTLSLAAWQKEINNISKIPGS